MRLGNSFLVKNLETIGGGIMLGGDEERTREYNLYRDTENDKPETVELRAGEYTIWIPTLPVTRISLKPGGPS